MPMPKMDVFNSTMHDRVDKGPNSVGTTSPPGLWPMRIDATQQPTTRWAARAAAEQAACSAGGCVQAGNKSLLSYRADKGVPGYTGYIPGPASIGLVVKGFEHTGRPADAATHERLAKQAADPKRDTQ